MGYSTLKKEYKKQIKLVIDHIQILNLEKEILHQFYEYTLHDLKHFQQVADNAERIISGLKLSDKELFCLFAACYCHDLGMSHTNAQQKEQLSDVNEIRKLHATFSRIYINENLRTCIPNETFREAIGKISEGHGRWDWEDPYFNDIDDIRIRFLVSVLSLSDLLDLRNDRKNPNNFIDVENLLNGSLKSSISIIHWLKHYYSKKPSIVNVNGTIEITLKAEVGTKKIGSHEYHFRTPLIQELIQGEILKVINHPTFVKVSQKYFSIKLIQSTSEWPSFVHLTESDKFEFPESLVGDVLKHNFLYPRSIELKTSLEYKRISLNPLISYTDLQISYTERPKSILPSKVNKIKKEIANNVHKDNWDIIVWSIDHYIKDINTIFQNSTIKDVVNRTNSLLDISDMIKNGHVKKLFIETTGLPLITATSTKYVAKQAYKFNKDSSYKRRLFGGRIDILSNFQQEIYGRYRMSVISQLGNLLNIDDFNSKISSDFAYNCSIIPIYKIAETLKSYRFDEKDIIEREKLIQRLEPITKLGQYNEKIFQLRIGLKIRVSEFDETQIENLIILDIAGFPYPWKFHSKTIKSLKHPEALNLILWNDSEIIGYLFAKRMNNNCYIRKMVIHPFFRRKGFGEYLVRELMSKEGIYKMFTLCVRKSNFGAINLYRKIGFQYQFEVEGHFKRTGQSVDDKTGIFMKLAIDEINH